MFSVELMRKVDIIEPKIKEVLLSLIDEIEQQYASERKINDLGNFVKTGFDELKGIVRELAEAQKITEQKVGELTEVQKITERKFGELAEAQKITEQKIGELAEAQKNTEKEIAKLSGKIDNTNHHLGGLAKSVAYSLENEAYRKLPPYLEEKFKISISDRLIRTFVEGEEINILAAAKRNGEDVMLVGETVLKLDDRSKMRKLNKKVKVVAKNYDKIIIPMIITHFANPDIIRSASDKGVLIVQSFEWD